MSCVPLSRHTSRWLLVSGIVLLLLLPACSTDIARPDGVPAEAVAVQPAQARVVATVNFGASSLLDATVALAEDTTAIEALQSVAGVVTSYGGCYVEDIEDVGTTSGSRDEDWFYFINGILADVGSCDYLMRDGDMQHWDYHSWRFRRDVTATLGVFPHAYVNGYAGDVRPTTVVCDSVFAEEAEDLADELKAAGAQEVSLLVGESPSESTMQDNNLLLVVSPGNTLSEELYGVRDRLGLFTAIANSTVSVYNTRGEVSGTYTSRTGVIEAMQNPWNPHGTGACENVVILVTGTDGEGVRMAANVLAGSWGDIELWSAAVVVDGIPSLVPSPL